MNADDNPKLKKPLRNMTLYDVLSDEPDLYRKIADDCILVATGLIEQQKPKAIDRLREYIQKDRMSMFLGNLKIV